MPLFAFSLSLSFCLCLSLRAPHCIHKLAVTRTSQLLRNTVSEVVSNFCPCFLGLCAVFLYLDRCRSNWICNSRLWVTTGRDCVQQWLPRNSRSLRLWSLVQAYTNHPLSLQFESLSLMVRNYMTPLWLEGHGVVEVSSVSLTSPLTAIHKHNDSRLKVQSVMNNTK